MGSLTLKIGNLTATATATDSNATEILQAMLESDGYVLADMTAQQQADAVISTFVQYANSKARIYKQEQAATATVVPIFE